MACFWVSDGVAFFWTPGALTVAMTLSRLQNEPLGGELVVGAAEHREPPGHRRRGPSCLQ